jgi:poly(A) polymerase
MSKERVQFLHNEAPGAPEIFSRDQHCISRSDIDPDALKILYRLHQHGFKAFLVGGGVRDLLLQKKPKDFDISTDATPKQIKNLFRNCRIIGRRFKLAHIFFHGNKIIEVSTFRASGNGDDALETPAAGSSLSVSDNVFGDEETDALRRDITINGLFYDIASFSVIDYVGGMHDLENGVVRIIGDPDTRFKEDPVRMLRVIRHAVRAGFRIDKTTWEALVRLRDLICDVPPMRIYEEIKKDLIGGRSLEILRALRRAELLELLLPALDAGPMEILSHRSALAHSLEHLDAQIVAGVIESPVTVMLAVMVYHGGGGDEGENSVNEIIHTFFRELAVPKKEKERIAQIMVDWGVLLAADAEALKPSLLKRRSSVNELLIFVEAIAPEREDILSMLQASRRADVHAVARERRDSRGERSRPRNYRSRQAR